MTLSSTGSPAPPAGSFSVVAVVLETQNVLRRFVDYYIDLGAVEIVLFYDGVVPDELKDLGEKVKVVQCDDGFWDRLGTPRPYLFFARQNAIYQAHAPAAQGEWLLVVDADEFVLGDGPVKDLLVRVPEEVVSLRLPTAEAVYAPDDDEDAIFGSTWYRLPLRGARRLLLPLIYGSFAEYMKDGLLAHNSGKQFVRLPAEGVEIRAHDSRVDGKLVSHWSPQYEPPGQKYYVAHFDAICVSRWKEKWLGRINEFPRRSTMRPLRVKQLEEVAAALTEGDESARKLFRRYYGLSRYQLLALRLLGRAFERRLFR